MATITAAIVARDEERHIGACLDTLAWADDLLVVLDDRPRLPRRRARGSRLKPLPRSQLNATPRSIS